jgi:hypothetical protein
MVMEIIILSAFITGWISCQLYIGYKIHKTLERVAKDNNMSFDQLANVLADSQSIKSSVIKVQNFFTETNSNSIMLYNKDTGKFMGQASSIDELADNLYNYDKIKFALVSHNDTLVWFVEGRVKNDLQDINEN